MLQPIIELSRRPSLSPEPHAVAVDGNTLWISSRKTRRIDVIDASTWQKTGEVDPPGMPWGMTFDNGEVVMTCGETAEDNRWVRRFAPGKGFGEGYACPEDTGSHVGMLDGRLVLGQWYNKRLLLMDHDGNVLEEFSAPHGIAGVAIRDGIAYVLGTDDEDNGEYWITRIDLRDRNVPPEDIALVPFRARGMAWDGKQWWTNHREADQVVSFELPR